MWGHLASSWGDLQTTHHLNGSVVPGGVTFTATPLGTATAALTIGVTSGNNSEVFLGLIADLHPYDRTLLPTEINRWTNGAAISEPGTCAALAGLAVLGRTVPCQWHHLPV